MLNQITIMGRMTRDPELRRTAMQTPVASFTLAVDRDFADKETGERATDFIDCVAWRSTAEFISKYFAKGSLSVVTGRLQIRDWTDKEGNKRRNAEVIVDNIYFGESKRRESESSYQNNYTAPAYSAQSYAPASAPAYSAPSYAPAAAPAAPAVSNEFSTLSDDDGELPF